MQPPAQAAAHGFLLDKIALACLLALALSLVLAGVLRYYLAVAGMPWLIYLPKLVVVLAVAGLLARVAASRQVDRLLLGALMLIGTYALVGVYFTGSALQAAFGVFVLLPLLFALLMEPALRRSGPRLGLFLGILWLVAAGGVVYDYLAQVPWIGSSYQLAGQEVTTARQWWALGVARTAGFSRASFMVSSQLLFLALGVVILMRPRWIKVLVWLITGVLIAVTTTKKSILIYLAFTFLLPFLQARSLSRPVKHSVTRTLPPVVGLIGALLPLSTLVVRYQLNLENDFARAMLTSFEERLTEMWPQAFDLLATHGNLVLGRGIGGIGVAQMYFEPLLLNTADNLYLYLYVTFGLLAVVLIGFFVFGVCRLNPHLHEWDRLIWCWAIVILLSGWASNVLENGFSQIILGVTLGYVFRGRARLASARKNRRAPALRPGAAPVSG